MLLMKWEELPDYMQNAEVRRYYEILQNKKASLLAKRALDLVISVILIILLILPMCVIAAVVKASSPGKILFRQDRVTTNGRIFRILKFRTMVEGAENLGGQITETDDRRITKNGKFLRKYRLDELPQIFNVFTGAMSLVGTRPEVPKYVKKYTPEMYATLLMPAGVTSYASIHFRDEDELFRDPATGEKNYMEVVLPEKMVQNLKYIEEFSFLYDLKIMVRTVADVF
mgnify:FL=1